MRLIFLLFRLMYSYPGFQIAMPAGYMIHGIDVSRYQRTINWKDVKDMKEGNVRIGFAFIKATEGHWQCR